MERKEKIASTCNLTTLELRERKRTVIAAIKMLVLERTELANGFGYDFDVSDQTLDTLNEFIKAERKCCDFFTFQLTSAQDLLRFVITGPDGAKEFIRDEIGL